MHYFVTGGSGWIGSAVIPELISADHTVTGLARSDASEASLRQMGAEAVRGDLDDLDTLATQAMAADGVVHLAFRHDFGDFAAAAAIDARTISTLGEALVGTGKPFVVTSGTPIVPGAIATEQDRTDTAGPAAAREQNADLALAFASRGVRVSVVRLPRSVHGVGDTHGFVATLAAIARREGVSGYIADGSARWPAVHVRDAAHLYRLAVEGAPAGSVLHAVGEEGIPFVEIADAIARDLGVDTAQVSVDALGFLGALAALDQPASAHRTREVLGWAPRERTLVADIDAGVYGR